MLGPELYDKCPSGAILNPVSSLQSQHLGTEAFMAAAREAAAGLYQDGLGVRAEVELQCLVGLVP